MSTMLNRGVEKYRNRHRAATPGSELSSVVSTLSPPRQRAPSIQSGVPQKPFTSTSRLCVTSKDTLQKSLQNHTYSLPVFPGLGNRSRKGCWGRRGYCGVSWQRREEQRSTEKEGRPRKKRASPTRGQRVSQEIKDIVEHSGADIAKWAGELICIQLYSWESSKLQRREVPMHGHRPRGTNSHRECE